MSTKPFDDAFTEFERYELRESKPYAFQADRRGFVQTLGAGIVIAVAAESGHGQRRRRRNARRDELLSERFHLGEDGTVTVFTSKVEVGQGSRTQISQAAAEELDLPVDQIRLIMADTQQCPDDGGTAGSRTTPSTVPRVRNAAAALRDVLVDLAAKQLGVETTKLKMVQGTFTTDDGREISLADLAKQTAITESLKTSPTSDQANITPVTEWNVLGTDVMKVGGRDVVTGMARYPSDIIRPGMRYGKVVRPNSYGAQLISVNLEPAKAMERVTVVRDGDFVGCVAATSWQAEKAKQAIAVTAKWQPGDVHATSSDKLFGYLKNTARSGQSGRSRGSTWGNSQDAKNRAIKTISESYTIAYVQHAPMEPRAAVAEWNDGHLTVWTGTQQPSRVHSQLCDSFRLPDNRVRVIVPDTGGGFGGKHTGEAAIEAARLAKAAGYPVQLQWTREEEFTWAYFRPAGLIEVNAGIDSKGKLSNWEFTNYNSGGSAIETPYHSPNGRTRFVSTNSPLRQGSYRALASAANTFARECAMDELAILANVDPLRFRLQHLKEQRLKDVLQAAAKKFDWPNRFSNQKKNRGLGLSCGTEKGSYTAACVEVEVVHNEIRVIEACQAFECGAIHNPANLRRQVEGCLVMGMGPALFEATEFSDGQISNPSFSTYRVPRLRDLPKIEIVLLNRADLPSVGGSETPIIAIAPAIANAVYEAIGKRCRSMPLSEMRLA